jgi:site-specific DNA recombinase
MNIKSHLRPALYARVSSEQQARDETIASQLEALRRRIAEDGLTPEESLCFVDEAISGSILVRPAMERLRDQAAAGRIDRLYVLHPDRLARSYAIQALLIDEIQRAGVEIIFLNHSHDPTPEGQLLLQVQGIISEYERAKILERNRRGKLHAARAGSVSVLSKVPFGYRYIDRKTGGGVARVEVVAEEAEVVRQIFAWVGLEGCSLSEVGRRLGARGLVTRTGLSRWRDSTIAAMLDNSAYTGTAMYGRRRSGPRRAEVRRPRRLKPGRSRSPGSIYRTEPSEQLPILVPAIVTAELFEAARGQLAENRKRRRIRATGSTVLLQGLLVCSQCGYAYHGTQSHPEKPHPYRYYRCGGSAPSRHDGQRICRNKLLNMGRLDAAVWEDVRGLLLDPGRLAAEHQRRWANPGGSDGPGDALLTRRIAGLRRSMDRLIDSYQDGYLEKEEFEPRIRGLRERLAQLEASAAGAAEQERSEEGLRQVIGAIEQFATGVRERLDQSDFATRQEIIRTLVDRIEIDDQAVRIVYKVNIVPFERCPSRGILQHCPLSFASVRSDLGGAGLAPRFARGLGLCRRLGLRLGQIHREATSLVSDAGDRP